MATAQPEVLIARHLARLRALPDPARIPQVLAKAGLTVDGEHVTRGGATITSGDCERYKRAIRDVYGEATYAFAKVNFVLGGCDCADCGEKR